MAKPHKYGAIRTEVDGHSFDSKAEARRYAVLKLRLKERERPIKDLRLQPEILLHVNGKRIGSYIGDFRYIDHEGNLVIEDVKSEPTKTPIYRWKKKHVAAEYGIEIVEVTG